MSSKKTNRLNRSPVRQKPTIAPMNTSAIASNRWSSTWMTSMHMTSAATPSTATNSANAPPSGSTAKSMPTAEPARGRQPPNQTTSVPPRACASVAAHRAAVATAATTPAIPATRRRDSGDVAASRVAASTGTSTASGATDTGAHSAAQGAERVGVAGAEALVGLHGQREQHRDDRRLDHDVGERQRLHHRIDPRRARRDVDEDRRLPPVAPADREQQHVRRRLHDAEAQDEMHEVAARDHAVQADQEQPDGDDVGEHYSPPRSIIW